MHIEFEKIKEEKPKLPPYCINCNINRSDPPSKLCLGCQAYREHQS